MKTQSLSIDLLRIDGGTQSRVKINEDVVEDYADLIGDEWPFPPLDVFHDGTEYHVADGFHRYLAGKRAKRGSFPCKVHTGTAKDAHIFGMTANDRHGLRMTREDKRACVEWLLDNMGKITQKDVAEKAGVSPSTVRNIVADRNPKSSSREKQKRQIASRPSRGTKDPFDDVDDPFEDPEDGEDGRREADGTDAQESTRRSPGSGTDQPAEDLGRCPNCLKTKWTKTEDGYVCAKCSHPHGANAESKEVSVAKLVDSLSAKHVGPLARGLTDVAEMNGGEGEQFSVANGGLNQMIAGLREMRKGVQ